MRVNFAGQNGHSFVWGSWGTLPLCERIRETVPSFLYSTLAVVVGGGGAVMDLFTEEAGDGGCAGRGGKERKTNDKFTCSRAQK